MSPKCATKNDNFKKPTRDYKCGVNRGVVQDVEQDFVNHFKLKIHTKHITTILFLNSISAILKNIYNYI